MPILPPTNPSTFYIGSVLINPKQILAWALLLLIGFGLFMMSGWLFSTGHIVICVPFAMVGIIPYLVLLFRIIASIGDFIFSNL